MGSSFRVTRPIDDTMIAHVSIPFKWGLLSESKSWETGIEYFVLSQSPLSGVFFQRKKKSSSPLTELVVKSQSPLSGVFFQREVTMSALSMYISEVSIPFKWGLLSEQRKMASTWPGCMKQSQSPLSGVFFQRGGCYVST